MGCLFIFPSFSVLKKGGRISPRRNVGDEIGIFPSSYKQVPKRKTNPFSTASSHHSNTAASEILSYSRCGIHATHRVLCHNLFWRVGYPVLENKCLEGLYRRIFNNISSSLFSFFQAISV